MTGTAPPPFSASEIRQGCPQGREVVTRNREADGSTTLWRTRFVSCDDDAATLQTQQLTEDGEEVGQAFTGEATWDTLESHAHFPAEATTVSEETIDTPLGAMDCLRYRVDVDEGPSRILWFARSLPGLPVRTAEVRDGETVLTSEVISDTRP